MRFASVTSAIVTAAGLKRDGRVERLGQGVHRAWQGGIRPRRDARLQVRKPRPLHGGDGGLAALQRRVALGKCVRGFRPDHALHVVLADRKAPVVEALLKTFDSVR